MSHLVMTQREFAGAPVTFAAAAVPQPEPHQPRRVLDLDRLSRHDSHVTISDQLDHANAFTSAGR
jgi:hypothetical protein